MVRLGGFEEVRQTPRLAAPEARDLLEVIDDRCMARSTLVSSQLPVENWH